MTENNESFSELYEQSLTQFAMSPGQLISAVIVRIDRDFVIVEAGLKSEAHIPVSEFKGEDVKVGDQVEVVIDTIENGFGETRLSHQKAKHAKVWSVLEKAFEAGDVIEGEISERVKGGFTVDLDPVSAFLPGSLIDVKPIRDTSFLEGKLLEFKIIKMDKRRNNVVISRRAVMESESTAERDERLDQLSEGMELTGTVKNITDYGAFIDLGGLDGLLHITDMSWKRIKHPSEMMQVGDE